MSMTAEKPYPHWDRRLDLRAVARRVLSEGPAARERARLRQRAPDLDRGQRHVLPLADRRRPSANGRARCRTASCSPSRDRASSPTAACSSEAGDSIERFLNSGVTELGDKLGPLLWQFAPFKKFDEADFGGFLELLPGNVQRPTAPPCRRGAPRQLQDAGVHRAAAEIQDRRRVHRSRHLSEHRRHHRRFRLRAAAAGRGRRSRPPIRRRRSMPGPSGSAPGRTARSRPTCRASTPKHKPKAVPRDVFAYVIHEGKVRAPAAAMALIERLKE